jgi:hypothetical protein
VVLVFNIETPKRTATVIKPLAREIQQIRHRVGQVGLVKPSQLEFLEYGANRRRGRVEENNELPDCRSGV